MEKKTTLCGKEMTLVANALLPRQYRNAFGRDLIAEMNTASKAYQTALKKDKSAMISTEVFENLAWLMLRAGGEDVGANVEEWLGGLPMLAIYDILEDVAGLWADSQKTTSTP